MNCSNVMVRAVGLGVLAGWLLLAAPQAAWAGPVDDAKAQGEIGERADGLLGAVKPAGMSSDVAQMISRINSERMGKYRDIASQNGTSVQAVQAIAGRKLMDKAAAGQYINQGNGWVKK